MRRVALLTLVPVLAMVAASCRHDGRTLREPKPGQDQSISTTSNPTEDTDGFGTPLPTDVSVPDTGSVSDTASLPLSDEDFFLSAPWADGEAIPATFTCDGANVSPALSWSPAPEGTVEVAITLTDLDAPFAHWAVAGIDPGVTSLGEDTVPLGAYEATNGAGAIGYTGPCPPAGSTHTYVFAVHYLAAATGLSDGVTNAELVDGISVAEIASAEVSGVYSRG